MHEHEKHCVHEHGHAHEYEQMHVQKLRVMEEIDRFAHKLIHDLSGVDKQTLAKIRELVAGHEEFETTIKTTVDALETRATDLFDYAQKFKDSFETVETLGKRATHYTPEMYGAVGDGVADDVSAVRSAIVSAAYEGVPVYLAKVYNAGGLVIPESNITIEGNGTLKGNIFVGGQEEYTEFLTLRGFTIEGTIYLRKIRRATFDSLHFTGNSPWCFTRDQSVIVGQHQTGYNKIINCSMATGEGFVYLPTVNGDAEFPYNDLEISGCTCNPVQTAFLKAQALDGAKIVNNYVQYFDYNTDLDKGSAIEIDFSDWMHISGNTIFETGRNGIMLNNSRHFNIVGNILGWIGENMPGNGIQITGGFYGGKLQKGIISNNVISQPSANGIYIENGGHISVTGNVCRFTYTPVYVGKTDRAISETMIAQAEHHLVEYDEATENLVISGNHGYSCVIRVYNPNTNHIIRDNYDSSVGAITSTRYARITDAEALGGVFTVPVCDVVGIELTAGAEISGIAWAGVFGRTLTIYCCNNEAPKIIHGGTPTAGRKIMLNNREDFVMRAYSTLTLWYNGSEWVEISRSY